MAVRPHSAPRSIQKLRKVGRHDELVLVCGAGILNSGNDASFRVVLDLLREVRGQEPTLLVTPFAEGAAAIAEETEARVVRLRQDLTVHRERGGRAAIARGVLGGEVRQVESMIRAVGEASLVVVTGTGIFDDYGERPWHMPYALLSWVVAARAARVPFACLAVGAGPIANPLSRRLMNLAARLMTRISYRDEDSRAFMADIGAGRDDATVCPDVVFAHPVPASPAADPTAAQATVGVGVMAYDGWDRAGSGAVHNRYVEMMAEVVTAVVESGDRVRLLIGQPIDIPTAEQLFGMLPPHVAERVEPAQFEPMPGLLRAIGACDLVVATRYHNVVAALLMRRPVVSLSYAPKNAELLRAFGCDTAMCDRSLEEADAGWVIERLRAVRTGRMGLPDDADARLMQWAEQVREEVRRVSDLAPRSSA